MPDAASSLDDWLTYIGRERPTDVARGLQPTRDIARRLGLLPPAPHNLIVAGTNGKGSTVVFAESLLLAMGYRVGATLSPHILQFNERIRIDGEPVSDAGITAALAVIDQARAGQVLSYFEFATLAALYLFREAGVDVTVLEVGLGGRLDTTNLVDGDVTVITSVGLDHMAILGPDRESIAAEKAGILRHGVPLVFGESDVPRSVQRLAAELAVPCVVLEQDYSFALGEAGWSVRAGQQRWAALPVPKLAPVNAATAVQAVSLLPLDRPLTRDHLVQAAVRGSLPGRFERRRFRDRALILDVGHNAHAAAFLSQQLATEPVAGRTIAIAGFFADKDAGAVIDALQPVVDEWVFVSTRGERGTAGAELYARHGRVGVDWEADLVGPALGETLMRSKPDDRIMLMGSFDVVEQACHWLQWQTARPELEAASD